MKFNVKFSYDLWNENYNKRSITSFEGLMKCKRFVMEGGSDFCLKWSRFTKKTLKSVKEKVVLLPSPFGI